MNRIRLGELSDCEFIRTYDEFTNLRGQEVADQRLFVWPDGHDPIGYVTLARDGFQGYPYIQFLCVHPHWRRRRVASDLLSHCEAQNVGRRVYTSTESNNVAMLALLSARGYVRAGSVAGLNRDGSDEVFFFRDAL
jgi:ribosomal protein S18 acetylase RimI-like enzyme